jgi:hypothetical protein
VAGKARIYAAGNLVGRAVQIGQATGRGLNSFFFMRECETHLISSPWNYQRPHVYQFDGHQATCMMPTVSDALHADLRCVHTRHFLFTDHGSALRAQRPAAVPTPAPAPARVPSRGPAG